MTRDPQALVSQLDYAFSDDELLGAALTHRSARGDNNERLEFLGDAVLGFVIAAELYRRAPLASEGELSRLRASLVKKATLAEIAGELKLGDYLALGSGELKSGGYRRASILADALEALLGAVYLDGGLSAAEQLIERLYADRLRAAVEKGASKDAKTRLQEFLQQRGLPLPEYTVSAIAGADHERRFTLACRAGEPPRVITGEGGSRRRAEQRAARAMLDALRNEEAK